MESISENTYVIQDDNLWLGDLCALLYLSLPLSFQTAYQIADVIDGFLEFRFALHLSRRAVGRFYGDLSHNSPRGRAEDIDAITEENGFLDRVGDEKYGGFHFPP